MVVVSPAQLTSLADVSPLVKVTVEPVLGELAPLGQLSSQSEVHGAPRQSDASDVASKLRLGMCGRGQGCVDEAAFGGDWGAHGMQAAKAQGQCRGEWDQDTCQHARAQHTHTHTHTHDTAHTHTHTRHGTHTHTHTPPPPSHAYAHLLP